MTDPLAVARRFLESDPNGPFPRDQLEAIACALIDVSAELDCAQIGAEAARDELAALLKECADELAEWIEHHYKHTKHYPNEARRYERDMSLVVRVRAALDALQKDGG